MPELPEVETIRMGLEKRLQGRTIVGVEGAGGRLVRHNPQGMLDLLAHLRDAQITEVARRGKFMWLRFADQDEAFVIHLGMSGQVRLHQSLLPGQVSLAKHEHLRLTLDDGATVSFVDPRTFGHLTISEVFTDEIGREVPTLAAALAPDPLEVEDRRRFLAPLKNSSRFVKTMLLDQRVVSGIGNIYADEALFRAGVHGERRGNALSRKVLLGILDSAAEVMGEAVKVGGTSFDALYVDTEGNPGYFSRRLFVYGREGEACANCGNQIQRTVLQSRSHFFCPTCQVRPRKKRLQ